MYIVTIKFRLVWGFVVLSCRSSIIRSVLESSNIEDCYMNNLICDMKYRLITLSWSMETILERSSWYRTMNGPMNSPTRLCTIFSRDTEALFPGPYVKFCIFGDRCLMIRFNLDFAWTSTIYLRAVRGACASSYSVVLDTLGPKNERSESYSRIRVQRIQLVQVQVYHYVLLRLSLV